MKNKKVAALLAILTGSVGGHKWYLGHTKSATIRLLFFWTGIPLLIGFVEGIIFISFTESEFDLYMAQKGAFISESATTTTTTNGEPLVHSLFASLKNKLILVFSVLFILSLVNIGLYYSILNQTNQQYQTHKLFSFMRMKGMGVYLESRKVARGITTAKIPLTAFINEYDQSLILLIKGGSYKTLASTYTIKPLAKNLTIFLPPLQRSWLLYRKNAQIVLTQMPQNDSLISPQAQASSVITSDQPTAAPQDASGENITADADSAVESAAIQSENPSAETFSNTKATTIKVPNPKFLAAFGYLEAHLEEFNETNRLFADALDKNVQMNDNYRSYLVISFVIIILVALLVSFWVIYQKMILPINELAKLSKKRTLGDLELAKDFKIEATEINQIANSIESLSLKIEQAAGFVEQMGNASEQTSNNKANEISKTDNKLINRLFDMRDQIRQGEQTEKKRIFVAESIAYFSDLLRMDMSDSKTFYKKINTALAERFGACQCAIFVARQSDEAGEASLEMVAAYAFNREKFIEKNIESGDGMAGQAYLEQQTIYMTDLPQAYLEIKSGLGQASPRALLVIPMKNNGLVTGVIEMASFKEFEPEQIELAEKLAENMAAAVTASNLADNTQKLLTDAQQMANQMRMQEAQMRQNIEEMQAIQEENMRKERLMEELNNQGLIREEELNTTNEEMRQNMEEMKVVQEQMYKLTKQAQTSQNLLTDFSQYMPGVLFQLSGSEGQQLKFTFAAASIEKYFGVKSLAFIDAGTEWQTMFETESEQPGWWVDLTPLNSKTATPNQTQMHWHGYLRSPGQSDYTYVSIEANACVKPKLTTWNGIILKHEPPVS